MIPLATKYVVGKDNFGVDHLVSAPGKSISASECCTNPGNDADFVGKNNGHVTMIFLDGSKTELFHSKEETTDTGVHWSDYTPEMMRCFYVLV